MANSKRSKRIIFFVGYSRISYVKEVKEKFSRKSFQVGCIYNRSPKSSYEKDCFSMFDLLIDARQGFQVLEEVTKRIAAITNTRERDANLYIEVLYKCGFINNKQKKLYHITNNKAELKNYLKKKLPNITPKYCHADNFEKESKSKGLRFPLIVKPTSLCGSLFVKIVYNTKQLNSFLKENKNKINSAGKKEFDRSVSIIAEEFVGGNQYSINSYASPGGHLMFCPIVRVVPAFEIGIDDTYCVFQYTDNNLPKKEAEKLWQKLSEVTNYLKIKGTSVHFDVVQSASGWKLLDMGLRVGSLRHTLFKYSHSMNHIGNDILNRLGETPYIPSRQKFACIVSKAPAKRGILQSINIPKNRYENTKIISEDYDIKKEEIGKEVAPVNLGGKKLTKHIVIGDNLQEVLNDARHLFDSISFSVNQ